MAEKYGVGVVQGATIGQPPLSVESEIIYMVVALPSDKETSPVKGKSQELYLCESYDDYKAAFGYSEYWGATIADRTLCPSAKSIWRLMNGFGIQPVLIYNVADNTTGLLPIVDESVQFAAGAGGDTQPLANGLVMTDTVIVTDNLGVVTYDEDDDYTMGFNSDGEFEIIRVASGLIGETDEVFVDYKYNDLSTVTTQDIIDGIDYVEQVIPELGFGKLPGWIHAPKYSQVVVNGTDPGAIRSALKTRCLSLNVLFKSRFVYDLDETAYGVTVAAGAPDSSKIYDDVNVRSDYGRGCFGEGSVPGSTEELLSDWFLGMHTREVADNGFPCVSPSNRVLEDYTPNYPLGWPTQSNNVRDKGIICTSADTADRGVTLWGTWTLYYNGTQTDYAKDSSNQNDVYVYLVKALTRDIWSKDIDRNVVLTRIDDILTRWNSVGASYVGRGKLLGWNLQFLEADNPDPISLLTFRLAILGPPTMNKVEVIIQLDLNYLDALFG